MRSHFYVKRLSWLIYNKNSVKFVQQLWCLVLSKSQSSVIISLSENIHHISIDFHQDFIRDPISSLRFQPQCLKCLSGVFCGVPYYSPRSHGNRLNAIINQFPTQQLDQFIRLSINPQKRLFCEFWVIHFTTGNTPDGKLWGGSLGKRPLHLDIKSEVLMTLWGGKGTVLWVGKGTVLWVSEAGLWDWHKDSHEGGNRSFLI